MMHNESFRRLGLDYAYLAFDVGTDNLKTAVEGLKVLGVRGFNLTMPDKNLMAEYCDKLSPAARDHRRRQHGRQRQWCSHRAYN